MTGSPVGVAVLGATGSIGRSALRVLERHPDRFRVAILTAGRRAEALDRLARDHGPDYAVLVEEPEAGYAPTWPGDWRIGTEPLVRAAEDPEAPIVLNALVGFAGLESTLAALRAGKRLALANKESLVVGGDLVVRAWREGPGELLPVDSEHSAILQCLSGRPAGEVRRLVLTASGGPFRRTPAARFDGIRPADALDHPTWSMGSKISIDSATLANKALEVIEGHLLFDVPYERIEVVVHPSSVVHSIVEFRDGSSMAQLGWPTMEIPILYALAAPERLENEFRPFDPVAASPLEFEPVREEDFPMFRLGVDAGREGGTAPALYNAANEEAVRAFLEERLDFPGIPAVVGRVLESADPGSAVSLEGLHAADEEGRRRAREEIRRRGSGRGTRPVLGGATFADPDAGPEDAQERKQDT